MKMCSKCKQIKILSEFYPHNRDGYQSTCKDCHREENKIYNRTPRRREYNKQKYQEWVDKGGLVAYREKPKVRARVQSGAIVQQALRAGKIEKLPCMICGNIASQAHHDNYDKPLEILWLCQKHHTLEHHRMKAEGK